METGNLSGMRMTDCLPRLRQRRQKNKGKMCAKWEFTVERISFKVSKLTTSRYARCTEIWLLIVTQSKTTTKTKKRHMKCDPDIWTGIIKPRTTGALHTSKSTDLGAFDVSLDNMFFFSVIRLFLTNNIMLFFVVCQALELSHVPRAYLRC